MGARPWLGALGLRGRIVGAVLVTAVATLAVAAVALLGPLESRLKRAELTTLAHDAVNAAGAFSHLSLAYVSDLSRQDPDFRYGEQERAALAKLQQEVGSSTGAVVTLLGNFDLSGRGYRMLPSADYSAVTLADQFGDAAQAIRQRRPVESFASIRGTEYARVAMRLKIGPRRYVLTLRRPLDEVSHAVAAVRTAFLIAAAAALLLTLTLGIPLSGTLVRRLHRLRQAALRLAEGEAAVDLPVDRVRDEVGDLARTFALMQRQLRQQEEARRSFVATASHELRTPLATLDGLLELLDDDLRSGDPDLEDAQALLERARAQSRRLGRLAADLLDLSRIDAQVELRCEPVELGELSRAVLAEFDLATAERGITTSLDDRGGSVWALGDPGSVARVVRILLDNAIRVSPGGSQVTVELRNGSSASLSVCDQGPGVAPEERELIFERFKRGRETAGKAGFGLGLAIGRELATRMGGELVLEEQESPGARFTLRLPAARAPEQEPVAVG